jgi:hypothetical protein
MTSATFCLPSDQTSSDDGTWKMHKENPQITPVPSSGATRQAQIKKDAETYVIRLFPLESLPILGN